MTRLIRIVGFFFQSDFQCPFSVNNKHIYYIFHITSIIKNIIKYVPVKDINIPLPKLVPANMKLSYLGDISFYTFLIGSRSGLFLSKFRSNDRTTNNTEQRTYLLSAPKFHYWIRTIHWKFTVIIYQPIQIYVSYLICRKQFEISSGKIKNSNFFVGTYSLLLKSILAYVQSLEAHWSWSHFVYIVDWCRWHYYFFKLFAKKKKSNIHFGHTWINVGIEREIVNYYQMKRWIANAIGSSEWKYDGFDFGKPYHLSGSV